MPLDSATAWATPDRGDLGLERVDVGTERRDPVRVERVEQELAPRPGDIGGGEVEAGHRARA